MLTLVDTCTMWAEAVPLTSSDSTHVVDALLTIFTRVGFPLQMLSDIGTQFRGNLMKEVMGILRAKQVYTSVYHASSNGQVERLNGTLITILRKLAMEKPDTWDTYVPAALFAYREVPHGSTGFSPATLLFVLPMKSPLEALLHTWTDEKTEETVITASKYVEELKD